MAQPTEYQRQFNFTNFQQQNPTSPLTGNKVDQELDAVKTTLDQIRARLALIQRDDGRLVNGSVGADQLAAAFTGLQPPTKWTTGTAYLEDTYVLYDGAVYICREAHTAGTFSTDLAADKWELVYDFGGVAEEIAVIRDATLAAETDAETAATNAATSETNAATSETNAATSATNAATSATNAATSETNAASSATAAASSAAAAATAKTNAETAETNAETAQAAAEAARDTAFTNANVYADTAAGLAAVSLGDQFQVIDGEESIRYREDSGPVATEVARFPTARVLWRERVLRQAERDRVAGFTWTLADWYFEDIARFASTPWYDCDDISMLFQDVAGATPVTADGDEVRLIKAKNGNRDHDLIIHDTLLPGVYRVRGGVGTVHLNSVAGFSTRGNVTLRVPCFMAVACAWQAGTNKNIFGVVNASTSYLAIQTPTSTQHRPRIVTNGTGIGGATPGFNSYDGNYGHSPQRGVHVIHSQFSVGTHDVGVNDLGTMSEANGWNGSESATTKLRVGMASNTAESDLDGYFYGGFYFDGTLSAADRTNIVGYLKKRAEKPSLATDRNILIIGDSTGNNHEDYTGAGELAPVGGDWPFRLAKQIATDNAGYYVDIRRYWTQLNYNGPEILQDGTSGAIRIYNGSIPGSQPNEALGSNFAKQIRDLPPISEVWINHGYNIGASGSSDAAFRPAFMALIEAIKKVHPGAHFILTRQPDTLAGAAYTTAMLAAVDSLATMYGADVFDVWDAFDTYGGTLADLYSDGLHFSTTGATEAATQAIADYGAITITEHGPGYLDRRAANLLSNGRFYEWNAGVPTGWTKSGSGTLSEVIAVDSEMPENPVAAQIADTSGTSTYISQQIDATSLQGQTVTLGVRMHIPDGASTTPLSRIELVTNGTGGATTAQVISPKWDGGWQWVFNQCDVPADATTLDVRLYGRYSGAAALTVQYSEAVLVAGDKPRRAT